MSRILIVDDDRFVRELLKDMLAGHTLAEASNGEEALERLPAANPELVLLDLFMPKLSGLEALGKIREAAPSAKVVVISSLDAPAIVEQAKAAGASGFILKPFHPLEVQGAVEKALGKEA